MRIKVEYMLDNDDWTEEQFEEAEDKIFYITEEMIEDLIHQNVTLGRGDYIHSFSNIKKE